MADTDRVAAYVRRRIDGTVIKNTIQERTQYEKCHDCGMGLCDPQEWHPWAACVGFKETHDSRDVWERLNEIAKEGGAPWQ